MKKMSKTKKIIASVLVFMLAVTFILKFVAVSAGLEGITEFFGIGEPNSQSFYIDWFGIGSLVWLMIGLLILAYPESKVIRICSMIPLCLYGFLQLMALFITMAFGGAGYEDGYVFIDILWFAFTTAISFGPMLIIGLSLDW